MILRGTSLRPPCRVNSKCLCRQGAVSCFAEWPPRAPRIAARPNESRACQALARSLVWTRSSAPHQRRLGTPVGATPSSFTPPPPGTRIASQCCAVVQAPHCSDSHRASSLATLLQHHRWFRWSRRRLPDVMPNPGSPALHAGPGHMRPGTDRYLVAPSHSCAVLSSVTPQSPPADPAVTSLLLQGCRSFLSRIPISHGRSTLSLIQNIHCCRSLSDSLFVRLKPVTDRWIALCFVFRPPCLRLRDC